MTNKDTFVQEQGVCPVCGGNSLSYGDSELEGESIGYEWTCDDCGGEGTEWYSLLFAEHIINEQENKMLRVAVVTKLGNTKSFNAEAREDIDTYLLEIDTAEGLKAYKILNKDTKEVIEKWEEMK